MDPNQSNVPDGSQGAFPGANSSPYQVVWNPYMYGCQGPPSWFPQGFQQLPPNVPMMQPSTNGPQVLQPADASKQNDEADVEEVPIPPAPGPTGEGRSKKVVSRIKLGNFNPDEDVNVVKSWLEICCDPITTTTLTSLAQKKDRMWDRIMQRYNLRRGSDPERSVRSLQSRWDTIKAAVGKFSSSYADTMRENPSGMSDADKTTHAAANFARILKHNFAYMHCWEIMKDEPKWQDPKPRAFAKSAGGEGFGEASSHGPGTNDLGEDNSSPIGSAGKRPMGRDSAKADPTGKARSKKVVSRIKLSNFKPDEDVNIVKSWLEIRCDPITTTAQKKDHMWDRIMQQYNLRRGSYPERSLRSIQSRWETIKTEVGKFSSLYADTIRENPSGMSDADKTTHALKHNFVYLHCWEILKDEPNWQDPKPRAFAKSAGGEGFGEASSHGPDTNDLGEHNSSPIGSAGNRSMGTDSAKAAPTGEGFQQLPPSVPLIQPSTNGLQVLHPADASKQNDEADVEEVPISPVLAPTGEVRRKKVASRIKLGNFNPDEDVNIVKSWLEISCDPITSTAQKKDRLWDRIMQRYNLRRGSDPERSVRSLQSRWDTIKAEVGKFSSFYADAMRENPSGMSDADKTTHAAANFARILKHNFAYMHCWEIMKDEPKWQDPKPRAFAKSAGGEGFGEASSHGPGTNDLGEDNSSPIGSTGKRSMGRDSAKADPTGKARSKKVVSRIKLSNFKPDEDVNIVKSWLEIRCDPITTTAQKKDHMWDRIMQQYNLRRGSYPERSLRSIQSRWETIKTEVGKFSSLYADTIRENPSGMSDADKTTHALKHNFAYLHCWEILKDEPNWQDPKPRAFAKSAGGEGFGEASSHGPDTNDLGEHNSSPIGSAGNRSMGTDSAKAAPTGEGFQQLPPNVPLIQPSTNGLQVLHPADASKQNDEADVEEVPISPVLAPTGEVRRKKVASRIKLGNFNPDEDVNIVKSWLEISCDPITSTAQKKDRLRDRIMQRYNLRRGSDPERSVRSLQSRWDTIKAEVGKFSSFYADAMRENPSGMLDTDKTTHAAANFACILKHRFGYMHCWEIMKDEPKWQDPKPRAFAKSAAGGEGFGEDSSHGPDTNDLGEHNSSPIGSAGKRPTGRDSAKAAEKKANSSAGSTSSSEHASRMQDLSLHKNSIQQEELVSKNDRFQQLACIDEKRLEEMRRHNQSLLDIEQSRLEIEQEKIRMMREKHDMDRQEKEKQEDERILGIDLNACTPAQRMYYEALQEEIFEKIAARRVKRQKAS